MTTAVLRATTKETHCMSDQQTGYVAYQYVLLGEQPFKNLRITRPDTQQFYMLITLHLCVLYGS